MPPIVLIWLALLATPQGVLSTGTQGPTVQALQVELTSLHDYSGALDGIFGPKTTAGVTQLEQSAGLPQDGAAGPAVLGRIAAAVERNAPTLHEGAQGAVVRDLQGLLQADGVACTIDGNFGPATTAAVKTLQARRGITVDGVVGPETWQALFSRPYVVQSGDTLSLLAGRFALPLANLVAADGGKTSLQAGQNLLLPYAGWSASAAPAAAQASPQTTPTATSPTTSSGTTSTTSSGGSTPSGGSGSFIPASDLSQWGSAGTPDLSIVILAEDQSAARALERGGLPQGMLLALPQSLLGADTTGKALLATATAPKGSPSAVVWLGSANSADLRSLLRRGVRVLMAPRVVPSKVTSQASGGASFVVPVQGSDLPALTTLFAALHAKGYQFVPPAGF
ncbi:MAG: peptidoglycan-binding protein [Thermaerobacter sp.]|nr:peptidoglycan-binding protein [Thermaerobacter sp.]